MSGAASGFNDRLSRDAAPLTLLSNSVTPYLKVRLRVEDDRLAVDAPRTLLGLVSLGRTTTVYGAADILRIGVVTALLPDRALAVALLAAAAIAAPVAMFGRVLMIVFALWLLPLSLIKTLRIDTRDGRRRVVPICWFQTFDAALLAGEVGRR